MKLTELQLQKFCKKPDSEVKAFLAFGMDEGAVREAFVKVSQAIVPDLNDAFRVVNLEVADFKNNPSLLFDEAATLALLGGRRLIRVDGADENVFSSLSLFLDKYDGDSFVVLGAGNLTKTSKLRKLAESSNKMAYYVAYADNKGALASLISDDLKNAGKYADAAVVSWLAENMGADRGLTRSEIQKLITFVGAEPVITLEMAKAVVGDVSAISKEDLIYAVADGNFAEADRLLSRIFAEEENAAVSLIRMAIGHFQKLHISLARIENGASFDEVLRFIYPPLFYDKKNAFIHQLRIWKMANVERVLRHLIDVEIECKTTGNVLGTLCSNAFLNICRLVKSNHNV